MEYVGMREFDKFEAWAELAQQWLECYAIGNILSQLT